MKLFLSRLLVIAIIAGSPMLGLAQQKVAAAWTTKFKSQINWQRIHSLGYLIIGTNEALYGVNPADGKILWENKAFSAVTVEQYNEVEATEFVTISYLNDKNSKFPMQAIVEVVGGKVLFDSKKEQIGVLSKHVLPSGKLLVIGARPNTLVASLFMYDITTGKQLWANDDLFKSEQVAGKGLLGKLQAMSDQISSLQALTSEPLEMADLSMIITHPNFVIRLNSTDGKVLWKNGIQPSTRGQIYFSPFKKDVLFVGTEVESSTGSGFTTTSGSQKEPQKFYSNLYYAFNIQSGAALWKQPAKENDQLNQVIMHEKGMIICPRSSQKPTINLVNYETGQTSWGNKGKGIKAQGSVVSYITTSKGILITTGFDNAWNSKAEEFYLNVLDPNTGTLKFEKSVKLKGDLVSSELIDKGLLFATTRELNILDPNSGKLLWEKSLEAGVPFNGDKPRPFPIASKEKKLYVFSPNEKAVFEVDKSSGDYKKLTAAPIDFNGKEFPSSIEVVNDGLLLSSEQNIMKLGFDGLQKYYKYYPAPREPALMRALLAAQAIRAAYIGAAASAYSGAFAHASTQTDDQVGKALGNELSSAYGELSDAAFSYSAQAMKQYSARYKASSNTPDFLVMMTKQEKKGNQLIQVSKRTGEVSNAVDIKNDKEPEYDVDQIYNFIYYKPSATEIVCYKL